MKTTPKADTEINVDLWEFVPELPPRAERPAILNHVPLPEDRRTLVGIGLEVLLAEPTVGSAFGGRVIERLRARIEAAPPEQAARLHAIDLAISQHVSRLADLGSLLAGRGHLVASLRAQHRQLGELLAQIDAAPAGKAVAA